ncbi:MAG: hypothetical protein ACK53T_01380 [Planctomycetota bacterium]|jgi:hypothetical protein
MKKIIFLLLLISNYTYSQKVLVDINILKWSLEKDDSLQVIKKISLEKDSLIAKKDTIILTQDKIIKNYRLDSVIYNKIITNKDSIQSNSNKIVDIKKSENKELKRQNKLLKIISPVLIVIALLL